MLDIFYTYVVHISQVKLCIGNNRTVHTDVFFQYVGPAKAGVFYLYTTKETDNTNKQ